MRERAVNSKHRPNRPQARAENEDDRRKQCANRIPTARG
jgi:hypothetical protein